MRHLSAESFLNETECLGDATEVADLIKTGFLNMNHFIRDAKVGPEVESRQQRTMQLASQVLMSAPS